MGTLSTHVLDTSPGRPAAGIGWSSSTSTAPPIGDGVTDGDGRVASLGS